MYKLDDSPQHVTLASDSRPWYKEAYLWLVVGLPLSVVFAGLATVWIAFDGADSLVKDDYYKAGLAINRNQKKLKFAKAMGVEAMLMAFNGRLKIAIKPGQAKAVGKFFLDFAHPTLAARDFRLVGVWSADMQELKLELPPNFLQNSAGAHWQVSLVPEHGQWQLQGQWSQIEDGAEFSL